MEDPMSEKDRCFNARFVQRTLLPDLLCGILCLQLGVGMSSAQMPADNGVGGAKPGIISRPEPLWRTLSDMTPAEKRNARIEFETLNAADAPLQARLNQAAEQWNRGEAADAIAVVKFLEEGFGAFAMGISWRLPKRTGKMNGEALSAHGNSFNPHLDAHNGTSNLLIAMQDNDTSYHWRSYFSSDGGKNWAETYVWNSNTPIVDIGAVVVGDYFYISYTYENNPGSARLRRCLSSTGAADSSYAWVEVYNDTEANIVEFELSSNQESTNNRLYLFSILSDGRLTFDYSDEDGGSGSLAWTRFSTDVTDAGSYLDVAFNDRETPGAAGGWVFVVYRTTANKIDLFRFVNPFPESSVTEIAPWFSSYPRISAYRSCVVVVYLSDNSPYRGVNYAFSNDAGETWGHEILDFGNNGNLWEPVISLKRGGGIAVAYQRQSEGDDFVFMQHKNYDDRFFSAAEAATDIGLDLGWRMNLQALPEGGLGLVTIHSGGIPYYDRTPLIFSNSFELGDTLDWD